MLWLFFVGGCCGCCLRTQRNFQRLLLEKPSLVQLFRATEAQAASEESVDAYGRAGQRAIHKFLKKFAQAQRLWEETRIVPRCSKNF